MSDPTPRAPFDEPISTEAAYRLICLYNTDEGGRDAISARGWLKFSSWYNDAMSLTDGSYIYRDFFHGDLYHSNVYAKDVLDGFGLDFWPMSSEPVSERTV